MVTIGTLEWSVQVNNAAEAKEQAEQVESSVRSASETADTADSKVGGLAGKFKGLADSQMKAGAATDKVNAKMGFLSSAVMGAISSVMAFVGGIGALKAILIGGGIAAALVALGLAFKENFAGIQDRVMGFIDWLKETFQMGKNAVLGIWNSFMEGFSLGGGSLEGVETIINGVLNGITAAFETAWAIIKPVIAGLIAVFKPVAKVVGAVVGVVVNVLATLEEKFGVITKISTIIGTFIGVIAGIAAVIGVFYALFAAISTVVGIIGTLVALFNPITLAIMAVIAAIVALWVAWEENFLGIRDITNDIIGGIMSAWEWLKSGTKKAINKTISFIVDPFKKAYNLLVGNSIIPNIVDGIVSIFSGSIGAIGGAVGSVVDAITSPFEMAKELITGIVSSITDMASSVGEAVGGMVDSIPGSGAVGDAGSFVSKNVPGLDSGGIVKQGGLAEIHKGEAVVPADVTKEAVKEGTDSGGGGDQPIKVNVGGIEVGDQTIDLSKLTRTEQKKLAELIAEKLGDQVTNSVS